MIIMAKKAPIPEPWDRQPNETPKAYAAFSIYRDMGAERTLKAVAKQLNVTITNLARWSGPNEWVKRCNLWDTEQSRILRIEQEKEIKKMRRNHAKLAEAMLVKTAKALQRLPEDEIKASDIARMVEVASKLERISRGDVGDVVEEREAAEKQPPPVTFYIPDNGRDNQNGGDAI